MTEYMKNTRTLIPDWLARESKNAELSSTTGSDFVGHLTGSEFGKLKTIAAALALLDSLRKHPPLFNLGQVIATPGAVDLLDRAGNNVNDYLVRHVIGDWGDIPSQDAEANRLALEHRDRVMSIYRIGQKREPLWIITEHDRSITTCLLPEEY
ncbi:MAG TPA: hypothetical protein VIT92_09595 [Burkholderiaceae bacterium]